MHLWVRMTILLSCLALSLVGLVATKTRLLAAGEKPAAAVGCRPRLYPQLAGVSPAHQIALRHGEPFVRSERPARRRGR